MIPSRIVVAIVINIEVRRFFFIKDSLCEPDTGDYHVDQLDTDERNNYSAHAVDPKIVTQQYRRAHRAVFNPSQCQRDQGNDDQSIEDHGGEYRRFRCLQVHNVQRVENWKSAREHSWNDGEIFRYV